MILGKIRNRREKKIAKARQEIQADYEVEQRQQGKTPIGTIAHTLKTKKQYSMKEWNRFSPAQKQILTNRYAVVLTDHKTRKEKIRHYTDPKTINKGLKKFDEGMNKFEKYQKQFWKSWDSQFTSQMGGKKGKNPTNTVWGSSNKKKVKVY